MKQCISCRERHPMLSAGRAMLDRHVACYGTKLRRGRARGVTGEVRPLVGHQTMLVNHHTDTQSRSRPLTSGNGLIRQGTRRPCLNLPNEWPPIASSVTDFWLRFGSHRLYSVAIAPSAALLAKTLETCRVTKRNSNKWKKKLTGLPQTRERAFGSRDGTRI